MKFLLLKLSPQPHNYTAPFSALDKLHLLIILLVLLSLFCSKKGVNSSIENSHSSYRRKKVDEYAVA